MAAGIIDHETGTRDIRRLNGLYRFMPITATLAMVAAAAMAGVPLLNGFLSKEMFFAEALEVEGPVRALDRALPFIATLWGMFSVAYSLRFIHGVFFGPPPAGLPRVPQEPPRWMRFPIEFLVLACLAVGMLPALTIGPFLDIGVRALLGAAGARLQPGGLARLHHAVRDEPGRARRRRCALRAAAAATSRAARSARRCCRAIDGRRDLRPRAAGGLLALGALASSACSARSACSRSCAGWCSPRWSRDSGRCWSAGCTSARCPGRRSIRRSRWCGRSARPARWARPGRRSSTASPRSLLAGGAGLVVCLTFVVAGGARPRAHPAPGRDRHHGAAAARPALAAQAHSVRVDARRRARRAAAAAARPGARGRLRAAASPRSPTR